MFSKGFFRILSTKNVYLLTLSIFILYHFKPYIKELIIEKHFSSNFKVQLLLKYNNYVSFDNVDKDYEKLVLKPIKIQRLYNPIILASIITPVVIPFLRIR